MSLGFIKLGNAKGLSSELKEILSLHVQAGT